MDRIQAGTMSFDEYMKELSKEKTETVNGGTVRYSPFSRMLKAMNAPLDYAPAKGQRTAREILLQDYKVPEWSLTMFALADVARFGAWFQAATDPANMYRRLAHINADGSYWKGNPRATRRDYLGYIDRIIQGKRKSGKYGDPPSCFDLVWNNWGTAGTEGAEA